MQKVSVWDRESWDTIRRARGIGYAALAEATGCTYKAVCKWFYSERTPGLRSQILMAKVLRIPLNTLLSEINDPAAREAIRAVYND
ncbi:hypothetical protein GCM10009601_35550 [Streptomyces thermospinosisporus]|uniref:HTH cro/C1-type domain-containing protein n=1 Tax=Streptomyces thermospinosisporus TaxID=161482 RepID=A0ABP4JRK4_9ACTN